MIAYLVILAAIQGSVGTSPKENSKSIGVPPTDHVHLTHEQLIEIADQLLYEDIAEVDLDPETFEVPVSRPRKLKKSALDDVEFITEKAKKVDPIR